MSSTALTRARAVFLDLLELPDAERSTALERACGEDRDLRGLVERLLEKDRVPHALDASPLADVVAHHAAEALPESIGRFRIVRLLGEGGMGTVYEAEDPTTRRAVALKVLRAAHPTHEVLARFRREALVLSTLRDPGIAQVYEAGTDSLVAHGAPVAQVHYLALELVRGETLTHIVARRALRPREALELFARVCDAVHHAHERGVVHRDLKPSNILVVEAGSSADETVAGRYTPKVLDFGIARFLADDSQASLATRTGAVLGTLAYMSPEQARGDLDAIDARTDVWSLGVVLYEMLAGRRPFQVDGMPLAAAVRVIEDDDPPRLSSLDLRWRGDLDTIVAKALEKPRERRYASAAELAADVRRHLALEPIHARPQSRLAEFQKLARRHRAFLVGTIAVVTSLGVGLVLALVFAFQAERARKAEAEQSTIAEARRHEAEEAAYVANLQASEMAFEAHDLVRARERLGRVPVEMRTTFEYENMASRLDTRDGRVPLGSGALAMAVAPDERRIVVACVDGVVRLLDAGLTTPPRALCPPGARATSVAFDETGTRIVVAHDDGRVEILDLDGNSEASFDLPTLQRIAPWSAQVVHASFDDRRQKLLVRSHAGGSIFVDPHARTILAQQPEPIGYGPVVHDPSADVFHVVREACIDTIAHGTFEVTTGACIHRRVAYALARSPDGTRLASGGEDRVVLVSDAKVRRVLAELEAHTSPVLACAFGADSTRLATGAADGTVILWDVTRGTLLTELAGPTKPVRGLSFLSPSADGTRPARVIACAEDGYLSAWRADVESSSRVFRGHTSYVYDATLLDGGATLASAAWDGTVRTWDLASAAESSCVRVSDAPVVALTSTPDDRVVCATKEGVLILLDESRTRVEREVARITGTFARVRVSSAGSMAFLELEDGGVRAVDLASGGRRENLDIDGRLCLGGPSPIVGLRRDERGLYLWDVEGQREIVRLADTLDDVCCAARSARGDLVAAGDVRGDVAVWSATDGRMIARPHAHGGRIFTLAFDPGGTRLATGANESTPRVFDVHTGERRIALAGHGDYVKCVLFTSTGQLVSASGDGTLRAWRRAPFPALDR